MRIDQNSHERLISLVTLGLLSIGWTVAAQQPAGDEYKISATVQLVPLDISVRDHQGGFVSGLTKDDFKIFENGKSQTPAQFSSADDPVTIGLVVDNSGSMAPKRPEVVTAALVFVGASNPLDEVFVINFNDKVYRGLPDTVLFTDEIKQLRAALGRGPTVGRTALYDAVLEGLRQLEMGRQAKKTLIVISDGGDNISTHNFKEVMDAVLTSRATIYTVGIFDDEDQDRNPDVLKKLAHVSGGVAYFPDKLDKVVDICRQIAKDIRSRYSIAYVPPEASKPGIKHVKVEAISPARGKLSARTRSSYLVPGIQAADGRK